MDPELGVSLKVEARRIQELAGSQWWFSPDAGDSLTAAEAAIAILERKAEIVMALIPSLRLVHSVRGGGLPPSRLLEVDTKCHQAVRLLRRPALADADVGVLGTLVNESNEAVEKTKLKDDVLSQDILSREAVLLSRIFDTSAAPPALRSPFTPAFQEWSDPFTGLLNAPSALIDPVEYAARDARAIQLSILAEFITLGSGANDPTLADLIATLRSEDWNALSRARRMVNEAFDSKTADDVGKALAAGQVQVMVSHDTPDALDSVTMELCFTNARLNGAVARDQFRPEWTFGHIQPASGQQKAKPYSERGWEVRHFFPQLNQPVTYRTQVSVRRIQPATGPGTTQEYMFEKSFTVPGRSAAPGRRFWLELGRTASLMVVGAVVMQKSAQSLLANTNFWTVALGVVAAGFTIDTLKSGLDGIRGRA
jgi:hypothetical protein